ncbi:MAG: universal stress protein [Bacteroidetes bacterium]|nr:universal stress protein [Bacteroidota bacterium]MBU1719120.1 universal stress protein [Bacteroidota bacterium]
MKIVLIALDYDPTAQKVLETGYELAKGMGAEVVLLHVITDPDVYSSLGHVTIMGFAGYMDTTEIEPAEGGVISLRESSITYLEKSKQHLGDLTIQTLVEEGDFADSIVKAAKDMHADVIVMGSHSRKWLTDVVIGSVTEKVLRNTSVPIFIVPTKKKDELPSGDK